jgi:hypothetical protein
MIIKYSLKGYNKQNKKKIRINGKNLIIYYNYKTITILIIIPYKNKFIY